LDKRQGRQKTRKDPTTNRGGEKLEWPQKYRMMKGNVRDPTRGGWGQFVYFVLGGKILGEWGRMGRWLSGKKKTRWVKNSREEKRK